LPQLLRPAVGPAGPTKKATAGEDDPIEAFSWTWPGVLPTELSVRKPSGGAPTSGRTARNRQDGTGSSHPFDTTSRRRQLKSGTNSAAATTSRSIALPGSLCARRERHASGGRFASHRTRMLSCSRSSEGGTICSCVKR